MLLPRPLIALASFGLLCLAACTARLDADESPKTKASASGQTATAVFAGGCFWCVETDFDHAPGVIDVVSGYSGGTTENPTYQTYHDGHHIEVVQVTYDPTKVTYAGLVEWLIKHIDPTDATGQFVDRGDGYKPAIFYADAEEKQAAERVLEQIEAMGVFKKPLRVELLPRSEFYPAEGYHQNFKRTSTAHYTRYRSGTGRDRFSRSVWGKRANILELPGAYPEGVSGKQVVEAE